MAIDTQSDISLIREDLVDRVGPLTWPEAAVTITGTGFTGTTGVTFGGTPATGVTVVDDTTITATTPAHAPGAVDVVVTTPAGPSEPGDFTFDAVPAITSVAPASGPETGGTDVTIDLQIACTLPLPGLARPAVERVMAGVVKHMGTVFSRNLLKHLGEA